jgi:hypothetical protein
MYTINQERLAHGCCQVAENFAPGKRIDLWNESPD